MNKIFLQLWLMTLGGLILHSCTQNEAIPEVEDPENEMTFQANEGASRAFIDGNLSTTNTTMCIYGYKGNTPLANAKGDKALIGKTLKCLDGTNWAVVEDNSNNPITYYWEGEGTYRFFGWLTHDAASEKSIPNNLIPVNPNNNLSISAVIDKDYSQFDFLYSEINHRRMTAENFNLEKKQPVSMDMNHLFTAFAIGIRNTSEDDIVINSVTLNCVHDKGSVNIDFSENATANVPTESTSSVPSIIQYGATSKNVADNPFISYNGEHTLVNRTGYSPNIFNPTAGAKQFYMVWPQSGTVLNATSLTFADEDEEAEEPDASFPIVLEYSVGGVEFKKRMRLPNENWEPGQKYYLEVQIADKLVGITSTVLDWDYTASKVDFASSSISLKENGHLQWDQNTCTIDHTKEEVYVTNGAPVEATFCIDAPKGGQWGVSLEGDVTAFSIIDDASPTNDGLGPIDGEVHRIKIAPTIATPDRDYKVRLKFVAITADHKTYPADDMLQNSNNADIYTIILRSVK